MTGSSERASRSAVTQEATPVTSSVPPTRDAEWSGTLEAAGFDAAGVQRHPDRTLRPSAGDAEATADALTARLGDEGLVLHETLGEGGMGVVRSGTQLRLGREVAVKTLRPEGVTERAVAKLVREAWVTGSLEHPNIIPVHDIALGPGGAPQVVLKRVEGDDWSALLRDPETVRERFGVESALEQHIRILMQVCNAVHFAHSRGVIHRDIKPSNVMVGSFGEVYLADWGLAVALEDDGSGRLPVVTDVQTIAGTPVYMAPEQAWGTGRLGARTDVYLLGATLYHIVVGRPPHQGDSVGGLMSAIAASEPEMPPTVAPELQEIVRRAMHRDPEERFESAEALRQALSAFLEHRGAARLVASGLEALDALRALLATSLERADPADAQLLYDRCRFACRQALEVWPKAEGASATLADATTLMVEHALRRGEPARAMDLLRLLDDIPEELAARVDRAVARSEAEADRLRGLDREHDLATGRRVRFWLAGMIGAGWTLAPLAIEIGRRAGREVTHGPAMVWDAAGLVAVTAGILIFRRHVWSGAVNRRLGLAAATAFAVQLALHVGDAIRGVDALTTTVHQYPVWAAIAAGLALGVDRAFLLLAALYLAAFVYLSSDPEPVFLVMSACNAVVLAMVVRLSRRRQDSSS